MIISLNIRCNEILKFIYGIFWTRFEVVASNLQFVADLQGDSLRNLFQLAWFHKLYMFVKNTDSCNVRTLARFWSGIVLRDSLKTSPTRLWPIGYGMFKNGVYDFFIFLNIPKKSSIDSFPHPPVSFAANSKNFVHRLLKDNYKLYYN